MADSTNTLMESQHTAEARYGKMRTEREPFLRRARTAAMLTVPHLMPEDGHTGATELYTPFQGVGARGVNNLSAKALLALFPPGNSFFRLRLADKLRNEIEAAGDKDTIAEIDRALSEREKAVVNRMEEKGIRTTLYETLRQAFVCGNYLLQVVNSGSLVLHKLDHYCVKRDPAGNVLEIIVLQKLAREALPNDVLEALGDISELTSEKPSQATVDLYTSIKREQGHWEVYQEVKGQKIPGTEGKYPLDKSPWIVGRYTKIDGEDYGRGAVEEQIGDLSSLENLSQSIVEGAAASARVLWMVNEAGTTDKKAVAEAPNLEVVDGNAADVTVVQMQKYADFRVAKETMDGITSRLSAAFLLSASVQRQAERVTAEEVRFLASELEDALGGVYSLLSQELQRPLVIRMLHELQKDGTFKRLPEKAVRTQIVTGLEALGRGHDFQKILLLMSTVGQQVQPAVAEYINVGELLKLGATALGLDLGKAMRSEEEVQQARQQAQIQEMTQKLGPAGFKAGADLATQAQAQPTA